MLESWFPAGMILGSAQFCKTADFCTSGVLAASTEYICDELYTCII